MASETSEFRNVVSYLDLLIDISNSCSAHGLAVSFISA